MKPGAEAICRCPREEGEQVPTVEYAKIDGRGAPREGGQDPSYFNTSFALQGAPREGGQEAMLIGALSNKGLRLCGLPSG